MYTITAQVVKGSQLESEWIDEEIEVDESVADETDESEMSELSIEELEEMFNERN